MAVVDLLPLRLRRRLLVLYLRHRRAFWVLHSIWALATGVVVLVLSHERWELAGWVMLFLGLTWLSTLFFTRLTQRLPETAAAKLGREFVSYLTRVMYQETLFFLLPFYWATATPGSWNLLFVGLMAVLATLSCLDMVFDDLLRRHPGFGLLFFAVVAFAALNFLLPVLFGLRIELATPVAAAGGLAAALPLVRTRGGSAGSKLGPLAAGAVMAVLIVWPGRALLPPVPLRPLSIEWARGVEQEPLRPVGVLAGAASLADLDGELAVVAEVFAPRTLGADVVVVWRRDGEEVRRSRELRITPHRWGFRVWHAYRPRQGELRQGSYEVELRTADGRLLGRSALLLRAASASDR